MNDMDNRNYYKSFRIQIFVWVPVFILLLFVSTVVYGEEAGKLTASFDLNQKGGITSLRHGEGDIASAGRSRPTLLKVDLVKDGVSRYFDNTDSENFRCEDTVGGVQFYYDTHHSRELKVLAIVESHGDYPGFTCEVSCGNDVICSDILYPYINSYESLPGDRHLFLI